MSIFNDIEAPTKAPGRNQTGGFTLVEVVVAMLILGIVGVTLYVGLAQCLNSLRSERHRLRGTQILAEKMEVLRLYNWDQLNTPGYVPTQFKESFDPEAAGGSAGITYTGNIVITNAAVAAAYNDTMRRVIVSLTWTNGNIPQQQRMETLVSQFGVQNYVY
jgi:prepilin-type N-terminal cleavage/methylation domain-containing protein